MYVSEEETLSLKEVCEILSVSSATVGNWIRLGKLTASEDGKTFPKSLIEKLAEDIRSGKDGRLKSRRNKKGTSGKTLYAGYILNERNVRAAENMVAGCGSLDENELRTMLAYFAVMLYDSSAGTSFADNFFDAGDAHLTSDSVFNSLISDLLGGNSRLAGIPENIKFISECRLEFVPGEDTLGLVYMSLSDLGKRKRTGSYYTPMKTVLSLTDSLLSRADLRDKPICDPCCGTGNFLIGLLGKGVKAEYLYGQDIDVISVLTARINLFLLDRTLTRETLVSHIVCGNTLVHTFDGKFAAVLGNPPWGSVFSEEDVKYLSENYRTAKSKGTESYDLFIEKGFDMLEPDGCLAYVLPEALLSVASHKPARACILENGSFEFVEYLGSAFSGVQCPAVILGVRKDWRGSTENCLVRMNGESFTINENRKPDASLFSFNMNDSEYRCLNAISSVKNAVYLAGNAKFALGIVTGNNKEYIRTSAEEGCEAVLKGSDILRFSIKKPENYIRFVPEKFQQAAPEEMYRAEEKLLYRFICEVPVFAYDSKRTLSLNSCNILIPRIEGLDVKYILAVLNSSAAAYFITKKFNSVKLLRSHIEALPIPMISAEKQRPVIKKADRMINSRENIIDLYRELDNDIMDLYMLSEADKKIIWDCLKDKYLFLK
ncbi:MAG: N-6 DNA methylase [Prevotella sp.]|nr:N-6 DNA methylase [Prevotella sp.]